MIRTRVPIDQGELDRLNRALKPGRLRVKFVASGDADLTLTVSDYWRSAPQSGEIEMNPALGYDFPAALVHEMLHCGGLNKDGGDYEADFDSLGEPEFEALRRIPRQGFLDRWYSLLRNY